MNLPKCFVIFTMILAYVSAGCERRRNDDMLEFLCTGGNQDDIDRLPMDTGKLRIVHMNLGRITKDTFARFGSELWVLSCSHCGIADIEPGALRRLENLQQLSLSNNRLRNVRSDWFDGLEQLTYLDLSYNEIRSIENGVFENLPSLVDLRLSGNRLECLNLEDLGNLRELQRIFLNENKEFKCPNAVNQFLEERGVIFDNDPEWRRITQDLISPILPSMENDRIPTSKVPSFRERLHSSWMTTTERPTTTVVVPVEEVVNFPAPRWRVQDGDSRRPETWTTEDPRRLESWSTEDPRRPESWTTVDPRRPESFGTVDPRRPESWTTVDPRRPESWTTVDSRRPEFWTTEDPRRLESFGTVDPRRPEFWATVDPRRPESWTTVNPRRPESWTTVDPRRPESWTTVDPRRPESFGTVDPRRPDSWTTEDPRRLESLGPVDPRRPESWTTEDPRRLESFGPVDPRRPESWTTEDPRRLESFGPVDPRRPESWTTEDPRRLESTTPSILPPGPIPQNPYTIYYPTNTPTIVQEETTTSTHPPTYQLCTSSTCTTATVYQEYENEDRVVYPVEVTGTSATSQVKSNHPSDLEHNMAHGLETDRGYETPGNTAYRPSPTIPNNVEDIYRMIDSIIKETEEPGNRKPLPKEGSTIGTQEKDGGHGNISGINMEDLEQIYRQTNDPRIFTDVPDPAGYINNLLDPSRPDPDKINPPEETPEPSEPPERTNRTHMIRPYVPPGVLQPSSPNDLFETPYYEPTVTIRPPPVLSNTPEEVRPTSILVMETTTDKPLPECPNRSSATNLTASKLPWMIVLLVTMKNILRKL